MKKDLINEISKLHDKIIDILISTCAKDFGEINSVESDLTSYFENNSFNEWTIKELEDYIVYLKELIEFEEREGIE